jgi:plasmid stability protein
MKAGPDRKYAAEFREAAARHGRSTEVEVRAILIDAVKPQGWPKPGSVLADFGRHLRLTDAEVALLHQRDKLAPRAVDVH